MSVAIFARLPFTCEFCDIIKIYGRRRDEISGAMIGELDASASSAGERSIRCDIILLEITGGFGARPGVERCSAATAIRSSFHRSFIDLASRPAYWMDGQSKFLPCVHRIESPPRSPKGDKKFQNPGEPIGQHTLDSAAMALGHGWLHRGLDRIHQIF